MNTHANTHDQIVSELAKSYRSADAVGPDAALDANVLSAARRHLAQKQAVNLIQKKPARRHWLWVPGSVLACGMLAMVTLNLVRDDAGPAGFVQPASITNDAAAPDRPAYEHPVSEPLQAPAVERAGDLCAIRTKDGDIALELKRLEEAGCAASVARLRQPGGTEQKR